VGAPAVRAEPASAAQAQALMTQIEPLVGGLFGRAAGVPLISPDGDHYRVAVPLGATNQATARLAPLGAGRWALDDITLPSPLHLSAAPPLQIEAVIGAQNAHAVIDPSFASPSRLSAYADGIDVQSIDGPQSTAQHANALELAMAVLPADAQHVDITQTVNADGLSAKLHDGGADTMEMEALHLHLAGHLDRIKLDQVGPALAALRELAGLSRGDPAAVGALILALRDIASGGEIEESVDALHAAWGGQAGSADHVAVRFGATVPDGMLAASLDLAIDGAALEMLPPDVAALVPTHFKLQQSISGIRVADLAQLALVAAAPDDAAQRDAAIGALFAHGPISMDLTSLSFDIGPALLAASGKVVIAGPSVAAGAVRITAENFDALMQQVRRDPLTDLAYPMLVLARGLGKPVGDEMVWDVTSADGQLRINDTDLGSLLSGGR
jgi:hypothetical protein